MEQEHIQLRKQETKYVKMEASLRTKYGCILLLEAWCKLDDNLELNKLLDLQDVRIEFALL